MIKVAAAVIKYEDKVLLMRRAHGQKYAGMWEFPGIKVQENERASAALRRELDEELYIKANIGKLITSVVDGEHEVYAYNVEYLDGLITLHVHDDMQWVPLTDALKYNLLPSDRKIIMHMTNTKESVKKPETLDSALEQIIDKPVLDSSTNKYVVNIKNGFFGTSRSFSSQHAAISFYVDTVRYIINILQNRRLTNTKEK